MDLNRISFKYKRINLSAHYKENSIHFHVVLWELNIQVLYLMSMGHYAWQEDMIMILEMSKMIFNLPEQILVLQF